MNIIYDMPNERYHAEREHVSKSWLWRLKQKGPEWCKAMLDGNIQEKQTEAMFMGSALDTWLTEGDDAFNRKYITGGPTNPKTGKPYGQETRAYEEWAASSGKMALTDAQRDMLVAQREAFLEVPELVAMSRTARAQASLFGKVDGIFMKARPDWLHLGDAMESAFTMDLKTCQDVSDFQRDAWNYGYFHQYAMVNRLLAQDGILEPDNYLVVVEKRQCPRVRLFRLESDGLAKADSEIMALAQEWHDRSLRNDWRDPVVALPLNPPRWA